MVINMNCLNCEQAAQLKCIPEEIYLCLTHSKDFHNSYFELGSSLRSKLVDEVNELRQAKGDVVKKIAELIKSAQSIYQIVADYENKIKTYINLLEKEKFTQPELANLENLDKKMYLKRFNNEKIINQIKKLSSNTFINYKDIKKCFLDSHVGGFHCGAVTSDNTTLITGGFDSTIRIWNLAEKRQISVLYGHYSDVYSLALTNDSQSIISGSYDSTVRIWSLENKSLVAILKGHKNCVYTVCYYNERSLIISGGFDGEIIIWNFLNQEIIYKIDTGSEVHSLLLMKSESTLIAGINSNILFYSLMTYNKNKILVAKEGIVKSLTLSNDEKTLVSGSVDGLIIIWNLHNSSIIGYLIGHSNSVQSVLFTVDEKFIISGSDDFTVRVWDSERRVQVQEYNNHTSCVNFIVRLSNIFISLSEDSRIGELDVDREFFRVEWFLEPFKAHKETYTENYNFIAYASENKAAVWNTKINEDLNLNLDFNFKISFVEISTDAQFLLICLYNSSRNLIFWNLNTKEIITELNGHEDSVCCATFSRDNLKAASGSTDKTVRLWDLNNRIQESIFEHENTISSIKFTNYSKMLVSGDFNSIILVWNIEDYTLRYRINGHRSFIDKILISDDDKYIISGDFIAGIYIWNNYEERHELLFRYKKVAKGWFNYHGLKIESFERCFKH